MKKLVVDVHGASPTKCYCVDSGNKNTSRLIREIKPGLTAERLKEEINKTKENIKADEVCYDIPPGASGQIYRHVLLK